MSERRWGRVTVEGWIEQGQNMRWTEVWSERKGGRQVMATALDALTPTVEFLPEPVTFKDGDVIRYTEKVGSVLAGGVRVRVGVNEWSSVEGPRTTDSTVAMFLRSGYAVRLVPEANGD